MICILNGDIFRDRSYTNSLNTAYTWYRSLAREPPWVVYLTCTSNNQVDAHNWTIIHESVSRWWWTWWYSRNPLQNFHECSNIIV